MEQKTRYFQNNGREYVLKTADFPRPLLNYSWNDCFLSAFNHVATGHGLYCDKTNITATYIQPEGRVKLINDGNRFFYLRDADSKAVWGVAGYPTDASLPDYRCVMGLGYAIYESRFDDIAGCTRVFVDREHPCEIWTVTLTNHSSTHRTVQLFPAVEWSLEGYVPKSDYFSYLSTSVDESRSILYAWNTANERLHDRYNGFMASSKPFASFDTSWNAFLGVYGNVAMPQALKNGGCSNTLGNCERLAGAMELRFELEPGQSETVHILIGSCGVPEDARAMCDVLFAPQVIEQEFEKLAEAKEQQTRAMVIETPDERVNNLFNTWTKQQVILCAQVGRGASRGYRDALQDAWGYTSFDADAARDKITEALCHQYADGHAPRGWLPLNERHYSDSQVWIPMAVNGYLKETADFAFLELPLPFLDGTVGTVWEHCVRAVTHSYHDRGAHGLVLAHCGDWNDSLTGIGQGGKGESAWTAIALHYAILQMIEMAEQIQKDNQLLQKLHTMADELRAVVNDVAWDGEWFLEGYNDEGRAVGSHTEAEGSMYLNPQTWAVISRIAPVERLQQIMQQVDQRLECPYGSLTLSPAYTSPDLSIGRLTEFVPGIWENGCPYCHGSAFKMVADCMLGRGDAAYRTLQKVMPDAANNPTEVSGCEPYAFTNMYLGPDNPRPGFAMFGWISGTAGWVFRAVTQEMMGFQPTYHGIVIAPCIPSDWDACRFERQFRGNRYCLEIENPHHVQSGVASIELDGVLLEQAFIPYTEDGKKHHVRVVLG